MSTERPSFVWDYELGDGDFEALLQGRKTLGRLDRDWAAVRLLEYAPYPEIRRLLSLRDLVAGWPRWRARVRSQTRRRGLDFLVDWLQRQRPDLL
jgi:hypothetical protein